MPFFLAARPKKRKVASQPQYFPPVGSSVPLQYPSPATDPYQPYKQTFVAEGAVGPVLDTSKSHSFVTPKHHDSRQPHNPPPYLQQTGGQQTWMSNVELPRYNVSFDPQPPPHNQHNDVLLYNTIADKFSDVVSLIDEGSFHGTEQDLSIQLPQSASHDFLQANIRGGETSRALFKYDNKRPPRKQIHNSKDKSVNVFSKLDFYLNSRLPQTLAPIRFYLPTYPLLCLAAQYSESAYLSPQAPSERKHFVSADGRLGTKAMVVKSVPCDDKKTLVFAIRGTSMLNLRDWGVNLDTEPVSPQGFLDDSGNLCHGGFLRVAKAMIQPIAARLRALLEEDPGRTSCSLLITGHSAGGAVASLLYSHMLSTSVESELNLLTACFKRVHCVTFGAPPVSLLPLQKPRSADKRLVKCLFHSFVNEGDPVVRADRAYVRSLVDLLAAPAPSLTSAHSIEQTKLTRTRQKNSLVALGALGASMSRLDLSLKTSPTSKSVLPLAKPLPAKTNHAARQPLLWWDVPLGTLSNAGRLVVLRVPHPSSSVQAQKSQNQRCIQHDPNEDQVNAYLVNDEQIRQVMFGNPLAHSMELYKRRIETLAVKAVTGQLGC